MTEISIYQLIFALSLHLIDKMNVFFYVENRNDVKAKALKEASEDLKESLKESSSEVFFISKALSFYIF